MGAIHTYTGTLTTSGNNGSATGVLTLGPVNGRIIAVNYDYTSEPNTTDLTLATAGKNGKAQTLLTITSSNTDAWYYPRVAVHNTSGAAVTYDGTRPIVEMMAVDDYVTVTAAEADNAGTVAVTLLVERTIL